MIGTPLLVRIEHADEPRPDVSGFPALERAFASLEHEVRWGDLDVPGDALWSTSDVGDSARVAAELETYLQTGSADLRLYRQIESAEAGLPDAEDPSAPVLLCVWWGHPADNLDELQRWYRAEHIPNLMTVPGWLRIRQFERLVGAGPDLLNVHDLTDIAVFDLPEYDVALDSQWRLDLTARRTGYARMLLARDTVVG